MENSAKSSIFSILTLGWLVVVVIVYNMWPEVVPHDNWYFNIAFFAIFVFLMGLSVRYTILSDKESWKIGE